MELFAEYLAYMDAYRIFDPAFPFQTIAYEDDLDIAEFHTIENGFDGVVLIDFSSEILF